MSAIRLFVGSDHREQIGLHVFLESVWKHCKGPVEVTVLTPALATSLGIDTDGTNSFTKLRFVVPYLCAFKGHALFVDGVDMLCRADLADLWSWRNWRFPLQVVKHDYRTQHPKKYVGTDMEARNEDYPKKNQSSVMLFHCEAHEHRVLTPYFIDGQPGSYLHRFRWMDEEKVGELPKEWNHLVGEQDHDAAAKLVHYTLGIPGFSHYSTAPHSKEWKDTLKDSLRGMQ